MKLGPRNTNFGLGTLWRSFKVSSQTLCSRKRWFMDPKKDFLVMGDVCTLRCIVATGGGELRYLSFF